MKKTFFKFLNRLAVRLGLDRMASWSHAKWLREYATSGRLVDFFRFSSKNEKK